MRSLGSAMEVVVDEDSEILSETANLLGAVHMYAPKIITTKRKTK